MSYTQSAEAVLRKYGPAPIWTLTLYRAPVDAAIAKLADAVSGGEISRQQALGTAPDQFFHLTLVAQLQEQGTSIGIEKLDNITLTQNWKAKPNSQTFKVPYQWGAITLDQLMARGQAVMGDRFWSYHAFSNNCATFVSGLLRGSKLMTPAIDAWVNQDTTALILNTPQINQKAMVLITDTGRAAGRFADDAKKAINRTLSRSKSEAISKTGINKTTAQVDLDRFDDHFHSAEDT